MQNYQFRSMFARANKADGNLNINYSYLLEGRSLCIYYRSLFAASLSESLRFIRSGNFTIDGSFILSYNALIPLGKFYFPRINLMNRLRAYI
jgi:ribosomal protein S4